MTNQKYLERLCRIENFVKWKTNQSGQPRAYADSVYDYTVESNLSHQQVEDFCTKILYPCKNHQDDQRSWFESWYTFEKKGDGIYNYHVVSPYLD